MEHRNLSGVNLPFISFEQMKLGDTGEVITAKLASSNSDRCAISLPKEVSIKDESRVDDHLKLDDKDNEDDEVDYVEGVSIQVKGNDMDSDTSMVSSIKTSIDDETLMALA